MAITSDIRTMDIPEVIEQVMLAVAYQAEMARYHHEETGFFDDALPLLTGALGRLSHGDTAWDAHERVRRQAIQAVHGDHA